MEQKDTTSKLETLTLRRGFMKKLLATAAGIIILPGILNAADDKNKKTTGGIYPSPQSGANPFLGEIALFAFNFAPVGWLQCNGQTLPIASNQALFSLLGTFYGGNGSTTFMLPNLQGRVVISQGQGAGLSLHGIGDTGGEETHLLTQSEMPTHNHTLNASSTTGNSASPQNNYPAVNSEGVLQYSSSFPNTTMAAASIGTAGSSSAHNNMQPYLVMNYCIAYQGIFPSRG
jgi:microcystin-dependent protein